MAVKDVAYNIATFLISRKHGFTAALADIVGDIATTLSAGITGALTLAQGVSTETLGAFAAMAVGSLVGGVAGTRLGAVISDQLDDQKTKELSGD